MSTADKINVLFVVQRRLNLKERVHQFLIDIYYIKDLKRSFLAPSQKFGTIEMLRAYIFVCPERIHLYAHRALSSSNCFGVNTK